jgi:hypothetical protein
MMVACVSGGSDVVDHGCAITTKCDTRFWKLQRIGFA